MQDPKEYLGSLYRQFDKIRDEISEKCVSASDGQWSKMIKERDKLLQKIQDAEAFIEFRSMPQDKK